MTGFTRIALAMIVIGDLPPKSAGRRFHATKAAAFGAPQSKNRASPGRDRKYH